MPDLDAIRARLARFVRAIELMEERGIEPDLHTYSYARDVAALLATLDAKDKALEDAQNVAEAYRLHLECLRSDLAKDGAVAAWADDMDGWVGMNIQPTMPESLRYDEEMGTWRATTEIAEGGGTGLLKALMDVRKWHDSAPEAALDAQAQKEADRG